MIQVASIDEYKSMVVAADLEMKDRANKVKEVMGKYENLIEGLEKCYTHRIIEDNIGYMEKLRSIEDPPFEPLIRVKSLLQNKSIKFAKIMQNLYENYISESIDNKILRLCFDFGNPSLPDALSLFILHLSHKLSLPALNELTCFISLLIYHTIPAGSRHSATHIDPPLACDAMLAAIDTFTHTGYTQFMDSQSAVDHGYAYVVGMTDMHMQRAVDAVVMICGWLTAMRRTDRIVAVNNDLDD